MDNRRMETFIGKLREQRNKLVITVPEEVSRKLGLKGGDYVVVLIGKAEWYHLLDMDENPEIWNMLPETVKDELRRFKLAPKNRK